MKRFFLLLLINAAIASTAAVPDKNIVIKTSDGSATCALKAIRRITFQDGMMLVDMKDGSRMNRDTDRVNSVTFGSHEPGQETVVNGVTLSATFWVKDNILLVDCYVSTRVVLCMCDGKVVYDGVCTGEFSLDMNSLSAGMYVLKLNGCTYKIINR